MSETSTVNANGLLETWLKFRIFLDRDDYLGGKVKKLISFFLILGFAMPAMAQQKMDLDDLAIKGELHGDNRLRFYARQKNQMKNYVNFRTNFRDVIEQEVPDEILQFEENALATTDSENP